MWKFQGKHNGPWSINASETGHIQFTAQLKILISILLFDKIFHFLPSLFLQKLLSYKKTCMS